MWRLGFRLTFVHGTENIKFLFSSMKYFYTINVLALAEKICSLSLS